MKVMKAPSGESWAAVSSGSSKYTSRSTRGAGSSGGELTGDAVVVAHPMTKTKTKAPTQLGGLKFMVAI